MNWILLFFAIMSFIIACFPGFFIFAYLIKAKELLKGEIVPSVTFTFWMKRLRLDTNNLDNIPIIYGVSFTMLLAKIYKNLAILFAILAIASILLTLHYKFKEICYVRKTKRFTFTSIAWITRDRNYWLYQ